jgi:DNA-directed RNA polymerase specialized sigma24 family protein
MLDLTKHYRDVRRLTAAHPLYRVALQRGHDADDLMQSVLLGLLTRQLSRSRFDPQRASMSKYVHLVAGSILANLLDYQRRRARWEQVGAWHAGAEVDAATLAEGTTVADEAIVVALIVEELGGDEQEQRIVAALCGGFSVHSVRRAEGSDVVELVLEDLWGWLNA